MQDRSPILNLVVFALLTSACRDNHAAPPPRSAVVVVPVASAPAHDPEPEPVLIRPPVAIAPPAEAESEPETTATDPAPAGDACGLRARLRALPATDGYPRYSLTLTNTGKKRVRLVLPGDGSAVGWRTPSLTWIGTANGKPAQHAVVGRCGLTNPIDEKEIFELAPGQSRELNDWLDVPRFVPGTYDVSLRYRNDPTMKSRKAGMSDAVAQKISMSSTCDVTSNTVVATIAR